ncbi:4'-phosphopantetheinyl transferase family protein [Muriicola soli]|uniref:4'-phosphopantetheinyl transferase superfamily protein n=1 Tax=Muriicola soli TaxID=2507538 RepID=A0A411E8P3_9FLAO|nr:4'-phosphopantetheinyl transferase superfamily protein [Muriicola soli]QBA63903.1 4'-phosphopantetheinyl transferase superfamily protein [Muriicola soli]
MKQSNKSDILCNSVHLSTINIGIDTEDCEPIRLYKIKIASYVPLVSDAKLYLTKSERERSNKYRFEEDKHRFIICRILLKLLLVERTGLTINKIKLESSVNQKPFIPSYPSIHFNVSHAGAYGLIAIANCPVGIDIEYLNDQFDFMEILPNVFGAKEIDSIINAENEVYAFYKYWTRKEAIVKASGKGLDSETVKIPTLDGLHTVDSSLIGNLKKIHVRSFDVDENHIGAIAFQNNNYAQRRLFFAPLPKFKSD